MVAIPGDGFQLRARRTLRLGAGAGTGAVLV